MTLFHNHLLTYLRPYTDSYFFFRKHWIKPGLWYEMCDPKLDPPDI